MLRNFRRKFSAICDYTIRTHTCDELTAKHINQKVSVMGWLAFKRMDRFLVVRDSYGTVQAKLPPQLSSIVKDLPYESVIRIDGKVVDRGENRNLEMKTGEIEIEVDELTILNRASKDIPFLPDGNVQEKTRLKYRYIDLRSQKMQRSLRIRSEFVHNLRKFLVDQKKFVDVETPTLFRRTPGGAAEFVVPAPQPNLGQAYSLPQSPQQFKQLLMVGGIDRYFQVARCYRDEGSKGDRQPEFTQIDLEMSFTTQDGIMRLIEEMIVAAWPENLAHLRPKLPFPRVKYSEVLENYGSDKPDFRIPWKIEDDQKGVFGFLKLADSKDWVARVIVCKDTPKKIPNSVKKEWKRLIQMNEHGQNFAICQSTSSKWFKNLENAEIVKNFNFNPDSDTLLVSWGPSEGVNWSLGYLRNYVAEHNELRQKPEVVAHWVVDFPLFSKENGKMVSTHHPFTAAIPEHEKMLENETNLDEITGQHYDLVINGVEMGGGSIRIHNSDVQKHVLNLLNEPMEEMTHLIDALSYGAPPHGGFALGLDRFVALLTSEGNPTTPVRDVIAFPKTKNGRDLMSDSPASLDEKQIERYGITLREK